MSNERYLKELNKLVGKKVKARVSGGKAIHAATVQNHAHDNKPFIWIICGSQFSANNASSAHLSSGEVTCKKCLRIIKEK